MESNPKRSSVAAVRVLVAEDGGNPRTSDDIRRTAGGFLILPFSEDGDPNYKFRLDVDLVNDSPAPVETQFVIEWGDEEYAKFRRYVLLSQGDDWQKLPAELDGTRTRALVSVPPGSSHLSMHPAYNYARLCELLDGLDRSVFRVLSIGKSRRGRDIWAVDAGRADRRPLLVMVRVHPYESIGSFMMEGMIQWLGAGSAEVRGLLAEQRFAFLPMPNPDGVAEGTCKRTLGGLDVNEAAASTEPEGVALTAYFRSIRPMSTFDIHGYMHQNDGFGTNDIRRGGAIRDTLSVKPEWAQKKLHCHESVETEGGLANLGCMVQHEFGSARFGGSWSWYGRDAGCLRRMGVEMLRAYAAQFPPP